MCTSSILQIPDVFRLLIKVQKKKNVCLEGYGVDAVWIVGISKAPRSLTSSCPEEADDNICASEGSRMQDRESVTVKIVRNYYITNTEIIYVAFSR